MRSPSFQFRLIDGEAFVFGRGAGAAVHADGGWGLAIATVQAGMRSFSAKSRVARCAG